MTAVLKYPLVVNQAFIEATRDTGYRSTASAVAELVDNALQAKAKHVSIQIHDHETEGITISVLDDGTGMDSATLRQALQFGGSERFNDRTGPGRFGMGLPNSSVSQARRVTVYTWQQPAFVFGSYLDVDEVAAGQVFEIPRIRRMTLPDWCHAQKRRSGTLVQWSRCDRLDARRTSIVARKLLEPLGRAFRRFLWRGIKITINGDPVVPIDPLFLHESTPLAGAKAFGDPLTFELRDPHGSSKTSNVIVRFAELPVSPWHELPVDEKRRYRIIGGAGISIMRADREIDYGWYFFGPKRKENYDDWWRCELSFSPELDELFGVNHSKQGISPTTALKEILAPDLEAVARVLNQRVQSSFSVAKAARISSVFPIPIPDETAAQGKQKPKAQKAVRKEKGVRIEPGVVTSGAAFELKGDNGDECLIVNSDHPFFHEIYLPLSELGVAARKRIEWLLLAFAWAEKGADSERHRIFFRQLRVAWSDRLAELLEHVDDGRKTRASNAETKSQSRSRH